MARDAPPRGCAKCDGFRDRRGAIAILAPTAANIKACSQALARGELVVIPTETVYGLAASILSKEGLRKIFELKGRPFDNPMIVHVGSVRQAATVAHVSGLAEKLAGHFWPGPLTLVLVAKRVDPLVTGGLSTVAVRAPRHPVALALIEELGEPLAAPSANRFMRLSPTRPEHVSPEIAGGAFGILDGGPCEVGIESTVLDLSQETPVLLRPGGIPRAELESVVGPICESQGGARKSPGQYPRHYSPKAKLVIVSKASSNTTITLEDMPKDPAGYAAELYAALHQCDSQNPDVIEVEAPPRAPEWAAIWDRLGKAATPQ